MIAHKFFNIFAEENDITNTASLSYDVHGEQKSIQSNMVTTVITTPPPVFHNECSIDKKCVEVPGDGRDQCRTGNDYDCLAGQSVNIQLILEGRSNVGGQGPNYSITGAKLSIYPVGDTTPVFEDTDVSTDTSGQGTLSVTGLTAGASYDFKIKAGMYLSSIVANTPFADQMNLDFGNIRVGDLNGDDCVNTADKTLMNNGWFQDDPSADFNLDHMVNTADKTLMNNNWFQWCQ